MSRTSFTKPSPLWKLFCIYKLLPGLNFLPSTPINLMKEFPAKQFSSLAKQNVSLKTQAKQTSALNSLEIKIQSIKIHKKPNYVINITKKKSNQLTLKSKKYTNPQIKDSPKNTNLKYNFNFDWIYFFK